MADTAVLKEKLDGLNAELNGLSEQHTLVAQSVQAMKTRLSAADDGHSNNAKLQDRSRKLESEVAERLAKSVQLQAELDSLNVQLAAYRELTR